MEPGSVGIDSSDLAVLAGGMPTKLLSGMREILDKKKELGNDQFCKTYQILICDQCTDYFAVDTVLLRNNPSRICYLCVKKRQTLSVVSHGSVQREVAFAVLSILDEQLRREASGKCKCCEWGVSLPSNCNVTSWASESV